LGSRPIVPVVLGIVWAGLILTAVATSAAAVVVLLIPIGVVASVSAVRAVSTRSGGQVAGPRKRSLVVTGSRYGIAVVAPVALPLAALGGAGPAVAATALVIVGGGAVLFAVQPNAGALFYLRLLAGVQGPSVASMAVVLARSQGTNEAVALVVAVCGYDMAAFIFGTGRGAVGGAGGVMAGMLAVAVVAVFTAAAVDPPFSGSRPWIVFGVAGVLAPAGVALLSLVVSGARLPALRRLDSLALSGPAWVIAVALVLRR
jgi:hypothetical protein